MKFVKIPGSTAAILKGESLLNDASSLIIFRFALAAVATGQFIWQDASVDFVWMVTGGAGIGLFLGWLFVEAHKRLPTDAPSDTVLTVIEPYIMYWVAERLDSSGVLAVVAGGLYMANRRLTFLNSTSRIRGYSVWESFVFILNGIVFFIIGLELPEIEQGLRAEGISINAAIGYALIVTGVLIVSRLISAYVALLATIIFRPSVVPRARSLRQRLLIPFFLGWTGMRGVVSLAAALAIPVYLVEGVAFPHRNLILFITFVVILLTLVLQGLTLPLLIKYGKVFDGTGDEPEDTAKQRLKRELREHTYQFLRNKYETELQDHAGMEKLLQHWEQKTKLSDEEWITGKTKRIFLEMLESQRHFLVEFNKDPVVSDEVVRAQLFLIDLEEERIRMQ